MIELYSYPIIVARLKFKQLLINIATYSHPTAWNKSMFSKYLLTSKTWMGSYFGYSSFFSPQLMNLVVRQFFNHCFPEKVPAASSAGPVRMHGLWDNIIKSLLAKFGPLTAHWLTLHLCFFSCQTSFHIYLQMILEHFHNYVLLQILPKLP